MDSKSQVKLAMMSVIGLSFRLTVSLAGSRALLHTERIL